MNPTDWVRDIIEYGPMPQIERSHHVQCCYQDFVGTPGSMRLRQCTMHARVRREETRHKAGEIANGREYTHDNRDYCNHHAVEQSRFDKELYPNVYGGAFGLEGLNIARTVGSGELRKESGLCG